MIAIDTNVLVRVIVEDTDQPEQTKIARDLVENAEKVYLSQIVQIECTWVLAKVYKIDKTTLLTVLEHLLVNPAFILQRPEYFKTAIDLFRLGHADFADCLILTESSHLDAVLYTFDKRLGRHSNTRLL
ncbi:MAG: type II toxin-antitoxin system VapC family toxin [Methylobacter sp.]|nr:type II toxin-antitoxin system VapC family toxin [Methylobacter sp.]